VLDEELLDELLRPSVSEETKRTFGGDPDDYLGIGTAGGGNDATTHGPGVFGSFWWFNENRELWPDVPADAFQANGHWNRHALTVIPSLDLVVAWRASSALAAGPDNFPELMNEALGLLVESVEEPLMSEDR